ncbi:uncharacterized protein LOC100892563 isoform X3 [Strongylocentrotus purpuratus]|uniref:Fibronectin type-III domain-containing protein n=1 Tax=Strongylocentrotus purpuratus TaxID=7668 RepID=A0A7M7GH11_STRPU|nr:uncharacterized protein LOC100892563 isoform X3 [Strongylocentrotus purpuratus]
MVAFGSILIVLIVILYNEYVYSLYAPPLRVIDLGNLNFEASWNPIENYTGMYHLTSDPGKKNLCYTSATSCFLGGKLLEDKPCPLISVLAVTLEVDGRAPSSKWILNSHFRVGAPNILSPDILIDSTNITIVIQGAQTPLYYDHRDRRCRGESWEGEKSPIYMGQRVSKDGVKCEYNLTDAYGSRANHDLKNYFGELNENNGKLHIFLHKLTPFSNYSIVIWCKLNNVDGKSTVYNFTTKEDVPSSGPTIVKTSSEGLGCDKPDLRNITFTIQPPAEDQRHGILLFYEICYRVVSSNPDEEWHSEILNLPSPPPDSNIVTLKDTSRWDAYEVKVFANNSVGGMSSSVYQFEVLKSKQAQSQPQNVTTKEIKQGVWLLKWENPWSLHSGDCIKNYAVSTEEKHLGFTNTTSYILDTHLIGPVYTVKITPMVYNGTGPAIKGSEISTEAMPRSSPISNKFILILSILLAVFIFLLIVCAYLCVKHGPRSTQPFDISNNVVLKAALAMGDIRPKIPEREEFDTLVGIPPHPPPPPPHGDDGEDETETIALIETPPAGRVGGDASPHAPIPDRSPPHSTEGSLSEECDPIVAMETDGGNAQSLAPSSSSCGIDDGSREMVFKESLQCSGSSMDTSCSEDSLCPPPRYPSPTDSGYVQSPPPQMQPASYQAKPAEDNGYFRFDAFTNHLCKVLIDNGKLHPGGDANNRSHDDAVMSSIPQYTDSGYVAGTPMSSASMYPETAPFPDKYSMLKATRKQASIDSEDTATSGSLSPSDSEIGDGVGSYTKLSHPNTPLSPRSNALPGEERQAGWDSEKDFNSIQFLLHRLNDHAQHPDLSDVA